jgi:CRP-like cAMP-binding protein
MGYEHTAYLMYLAKVPMFASCSQHVIERVGELSEPVSIDGGTDVIRQGEPGDSFFVLVEGDAAVVRDDDVVATLGPGDYFGELALFDDAPRNATVTAANACVLAKLSRDHFRTALDEVSGLRDALLHGMAHRLHELDARV